MNNDKNQNRGYEKNNEFSPQEVKTREIDHEYYANAETSRNQWFNYSRPYSADDGEKRYQGRTGDDNGTVFNPSSGDGSTTDYAKTDQMHGKLDVNRNAFENTAPVEPFTDTEAHVNYNTAPRFAGDHLYTGGNQNKEYVSPDLCDCGTDCERDANCDCNSECNCDCDCDCEKDDDCHCDCDDLKDGRHDYTR